MNVNWEKNSLNNFICHLSWLKKLSPTHTHPLISIYEFLKPYKLIISWVWIIRKRLNVNWEKNSLNNFICHLSWLKKLSPTHTHPLISIHEFLKPYNWLFLEFESFVKGWMWIGKKIHSIILSVTCHGLRNFPPLIHIPSYPFICKRLNVNEFLKPYKLIISWVWIIRKRLNVNWEKNSLNNFICHLSWLKKLSPTHTHPLISIHEFLKPYNWLFLELESLIKGWMWIGKQFTQ